MERGMETDNERELDSEDMRGQNKIAMEVEEGYRKKRECEKRVWRRKI